MILKVSSWQRFTATEKSSSRKTQRMSNSLHELPKSFLAIWWIVKVMWWNKNVAKKVCKKDKSFAKTKALFLIDMDIRHPVKGVLYILSQKWVTSNFAGKIKNPWETWRLTGWRNCNGLKTPPFDFVKNAEYKKVTTNSAKKRRSTEQMSWHVPHILSKKAALKLEGGGGGGEISGNLLNPTEPIPLLCVLRPMFTNKTFATGFGFVFMLFWNQFCQSFVSTAGKEYQENVSKNRKWEWNTNREKSLVKITNRIINKISVRYFCYFSALFIAYPYSYGLTYRNNNGNWLLTLSLSTQIVTSVLSDLLNFL